jgi:chromosome segregation ATPase
MNDNGFENNVLDEIHLEYIKDKLPNDIKKLTEKLHEDIEKIEQITLTLAIHYEAIDDARKNIKMNAVSIEIVNVSIEKFIKNFDNIEKRFECIQAQTKIFHSNIKNNKTKLDVLTKERENKTDFNKRVNDNIVDIQTRLEKLESCKIKSPKENTILKRLEKLENKLNDLTQKTRKLENNTKDELIDSLKSELKKDIETDITLFKKTYDLKITSLIETYENKMTEFNTKHNQLISEISRLNNELENTNSLSCKNRDEVQNKLQVFEESHISYKNTYEDKDKCNKDTVKKINNEILDLKNILTNISNKNVKEDIDLEQIKIRISNNEQQIIHHMNVLSQNEQQFIQQGSMLNQLCTQHD